MIHYAILKNEDRNALEMIVTESLKAGYELAGGIAVDRNVHCVTFYQAIVRRLEEKPQKP